MYEPWLDQGSAAPGARRTRADLEIVATCHLEITASDPSGAASSTRSSRRSRPTWRDGGQGAELPHEVFDRMGDEEMAEEVQELYLEGKRDQRSH